MREDAGERGRKAKTVRKHILRTGFSEVLAKEVEKFGIKVTIIEPGGFRTDWAGSSMSVGEISDEYQATVGVLNDYRRQHSGKQQGDPAKAAQVLLQVAGMENPPLRLLLGSDALRLARRKLAQLAGEIDRWEGLTRSVDFAEEHV